MVFYINYLFKLVLHFYLPFDISLSNTYHLILPLYLVWILLQEKLSGLIGLLS